MYQADINEQHIVNINPTLLDTLLADKTTNSNIIWACNDYSNKGAKYKFSKPITSDLIIHDNQFVIKPRTKKSKSTISHRIKDKAEVFTPAWICNRQNNQIDKLWFNSNESPFNKELSKSWRTNTNLIDFSIYNKTWLDYIKSPKLEISCGEAPYITSRYDVVNGEFIEPKDRIGLLDRKLRIVNENTATTDEWLKYSLLALKSIYAFEWQGDSLLIARENILFSIIEFYYDKFNNEPDLDNLLKFAEIISWNIWQMDGIKCVIPESCKDKVINSVDLFGEEHQTIIKCPGCKESNNYKHNGIYCTIMDWETNKTVKYIDIIGENHGR